MSFMRVRVGSHMYEADTKDSDIDYLYLYVKPEGLMSSFLWEHHQLQYKEDGIDHNFTDIQSFIRNIMTGDSTVNFEVLHSNEFQNNPRVRFLYDNRKWFYSYNIMKSYLGLARRDLKFAKKLKPVVNGFNHKKLYHAARGVRAVQDILSGEYRNVAQEEAFKKYLKETKEGKILKCEADSIYKFTEAFCDQYRKDINTMLEKDHINRIMNVGRMACLDAWLKGFVQANKKDIDFNCDYFYNALEKGIEYER